MSVSISSIRRGTSLFGLVTRLHLLLVGYVASLLVRADAKRRQGEGGMSTAEWVLLIAFVVALVVTVGVIFKDKIVAFVNSITFTTP